jgi:hypothetical protein
VWQGSFTATTEHRLNVGGTCRSDWRATYRVTLREDGSVGGGGGRATLVPNSAGCDFDQGQLQAETVDLAVAGTWERQGKRVWLRLRFREAGVEPQGSLDVGAFLATIEVVRPVIHPVFDAPFDELGDVREVRRPDQNQGEYLATYEFLATCRSGCA